MMKYKCCYPHCLVFPHFRCHSGHASRPIGSGGRDGLAPSPAPIWPCPWRLPPATREQIHLEEGVSGCNGEVRRSCWLAVENIGRIIWSFNRILKYAFTKHSYFSDNQYPDEAKREEIATACNAVIQKPGRSNQGGSTLTEMIMQNIL